jgi:hypothetical protein
MKPKSNFKNNIKLTTEIRTKQNLNETKSNFKNNIKLTTEIRTEQNLNETKIKL